MFLDRAAKLPEYLIPLGKGGITFYAIGYLIGAFLALAVSSWRADRDGYPRDFFVNLFFVAFPMGIVGGRVWYVIADWSSFFGPEATQKWYEIWNGGMAIQGGALFGIVSGVLFAKFRRRGVPLLQAADWAVPTILIAQMIGRWGNFMNAEVHGNPVSITAYAGLPGFIIDQMGYSSEASTLPLDQMYVPLFLIEGLVNIAGYFFLTHGLEKVLGRWRLYGDETFGYLAWYGFTRLLLEPVRLSAYNMTQGGVMQAVLMAWIFVGVGLGLIVINHLVVNLGERGIVRFPSWLSEICVNHAPYYIPEANHFRSSKLSLKTEESHVA